MPYTLGKYRHLTQASTAQGQFCILAIDHRANLRAELERHSAAAIDDAAMLAFKLALLRALTPPVSAVLTDPPTLERGIRQGVLSGRIGLLAPLEVTDYSLHPSRRDTQFIPDWGVGHVKRVGGSGVKLLLYYNPADSKAAAKRALVRDIVAQCAQHDIPLFLEPIPYALDPAAPLSPQAHRDLVIASAAEFAQLGADVLKVPYPIIGQAPEREHAAALRDLDAACAATPWALLSAGVDYDTFFQQTQRAVQQGASGVIVGRAVWGEAVKLPTPTAREEFFREIALPRLQALAALCRDARDWRTR